MLHFSCDLCGKQLNEQRYVVKLEVFPAFDPEALDEESLDGDHLEEISEMILQSEETGKSELEDCAGKEFRFDLCPRCRMNFQKDPLGRDMLRRLNFSKN